MKQAVLKAPNDIVTPDDELIQYDRGIVASYKVDGNRCMCVDGHLFSSSWKHPSNIHLYRMLAALRKLCMDRKMVIDFEVYSPKSAGHHAMLSGFVNSHANSPPDDLQFYVFDAAPLSEWEDQCFHMPFEERIKLYQSIVDELDQDFVVSAMQVRLYDARQVTDLYSVALEKKYEGLMIRHLSIWQDGSRMRGGFWKHGRATLKQAVMFKMKNYVTIDGYILNVIQRRMLKDDWPRKYDQNGHLIRPLEKDAYTVTDMVGGFIVEIPGDPPIITEIGFGKGFDHDWRRKVWRVRL